MEFDVLREPTYASDMHLSLELFRLRLESAKRIQRGAFMQHAGLLGEAVLAVACARRLLHEPLPPEGGDARARLAVYVPRVRAMHAWQGMRIEPTIELMPDKPLVIRGQPTPVRGVCSMGPGVTRIRVRCIESVASMLGTLIHEMAHACIGYSAERHRTGGDGHTIDFRFVHLRGLCEAMRWTQPHPLRLTVDELAAMDVEIAGFAAALERLQSCQVGASSVASA